MWSHAARARNEPDPAVEGALIATPHFTHVEMAVRSAEVGKHVFVEKPLALTMADARRAADAASRAGVVLQLEGIHTAAGGHRPDLPTWRRDPLEAPFDRMTALGVHTVDTFHYYRLSLAEEEEEKALGSTLAPAPGKRPTATFGGGSPPVPFRSPPSAWIVAASNGGGNRCDASMSQLRWKEGS